VTTNADKRRQNVIPVHELASLPFEAHRLNGLSDHRILSHDENKSFAGGTAASRASGFPTEPAVPA
jgi:hypothetical protein